MNMLVEPVIGCIIRVDSSDRELLEGMRDAFCQLDQPSEIVDVHDFAPSAAGGARYYLKQERSGNLNLTGWIATFGRDLEDLDTDGLIPQLGDRFIVRYELVH